MSSEETVYGELRKTGMTPKEYAKVVLGREFENDVELREYLMFDSRADEFVEYDGMLYEMKIKKRFSDGAGELAIAFDHIQPNCIPFVVQFYNGGCSLEDAVCSALSSMESSLERSVEDER